MTFSLSKNLCILRLYQKLYHMHWYVSNRSSSRNLGKSPFTKVAGLQSTGCNGTRNKLLTKFLKVFLENYSIQPWVFLKFQKMFEIMAAVNSFLEKQMLTGSLQNSCCRQLFGKLPGRSVSVLKKDFNMYVLLGSFQKNFRNTNGGEFLNLHMYSM